jgi:hypothetical protein
MPRDISPIHCEMQLSRALIKALIKDKQLQDGKSSLNIFSTIFFRIKNN